MAVRFKDRGQARACAPRASIPFYRACDGIPRLGYGCGSTACLLRTCSGPLALRVARSRRDVWKWRLFAVGACFHRGFKCATASVAQAVFVGRLPLLARPQNPGVSGLTRSMGLRCGAPRSSRESFAERRFRKGKRSDLHRVEGALVRVDKPT